MADASRLSSAPGALPVLGVLVAAVGFGLVPYFARSLTEGGMAAHGVAFWRFLAAAILFAPFSIRERAARRALVWAIVAGLGMGLGWIGYVRALAVIPVSTAGVLYMTYPAMTVALVWAFGHGRPTTRSWAATGLIVMAAVLVGSPASIPLAQLPVAMLALTAPLGFGFAIFVLTCKLDGLSTFARMGAIGAGALAGLFPLVGLSAAGEILPDDPGGWVLVAGIAIGTALIPQYLYTVCAPRLGGGPSAIIGSAELMVMVAVGMVAFGEFPGIAETLACALIVAAIVLSATSGSRPRGRGGA